MSTTDDRRGQVVLEAAEVYERFFVPALFAQWAPTVLASAAVAPGDRVLDIGCGTGVLARAAAEQVGPSGEVVGLDRNDGMLQVARRSPAAVDWRAGRAESLPFPDGTFDRVVSQFALMFFDDREAAVREMARVVRPGGTVTVATWVEVEQVPGYAAMVELLRRVVDEPAAQALLAPFCLGTDTRLREVMTPVLPDVEVTRHEGAARFESIAAWLHTDIRGWTLAGRIDDAMFDRLLAEAERELRPFTDGEGRVVFSAPALVAASVARLE